jgi:hypothetical protein
MAKAQNKSNIEPRKLDEKNSLKTNVNSLMSAGLLV